MRPCNALSIAEACELPRETVRRKVVMLIKRGYLYHTDDGFLYLTSNVGDDFEDMTAEVVDHLRSEFLLLARLGWLAFGGHLVGRFGSSRPQERALRRSDGLRRGCHRRNRGFALALAEHAPQGHGPSVPTEEHQHPRDDGACDRHLRAHHGAPTGEDVGVQEADAKCRQ
jgi:hypothetical protein